MAVYSCRNVQIGYLPAERCGYIGALISSGREWKAVFQDLSDFGGWIRIAFDGSEPHIPAQVDQSGEFADEWDQSWPDEEG